MKRAILNIATGAWYPAGQNRLGRSLVKHGETADKLFSTSFPEGCPTHDEINYGFKPWVFDHAREQGYRQAFWLDASVWLAGPLPWDHLTKHGYLFGREGWQVGEWCNENALTLLGITREEAMAIPLMEGKIIGLDFTSQFANDWLDRWLYAAKIGAFNGDWSDHRHDITCGAVVAHWLGMELTDNTVALTKDPPFTPFVFARGM